MGLISLLLAAGDNKPALFNRMFDNPGDDRVLANIKMFVAIFAIFALIYEAIRESDGNPVPRMWKKMTGGFFAVLGIICYFQFFDIGYKDFYHRWEFFHYYVGSKYFNEIGYEGIYVCAAVAESELPEDDAHKGDKPKQNAKLRKLRDLRVNLITEAREYVEKPENCKGGSYGNQAFTPERWEMFKRDVSFFRRVSLGNYWNDMQKDHGYNPPPVWGLTGRLFATLVQPASEMNMKLLSCIDPILFTAAFGFIAWAFGWRVLCVALAFWGTQDASPFYWTGGAYLRQDWLFYIILAACLMRKRWYALGGAALAYSTLLRVFPIGFYLGFFAAAAGYAYRAYKKDPTGAFEGGAMQTWLRLTYGPIRRVALGSALGAIVLLGASSMNSGVKSWMDFKHHIGVHAGTNLTNNMGWRTIIKHSVDGRMAIARDQRKMDPFETWKEMRKTREKELGVIRWGGAAIMLGMFFYACFRLKSPWIVLSLGCIAVITLIELTDYYYSFFVLGALLTRGRRPLEIALMAAAALSEICNIRLDMFDDRFVAMSVVFVVLGLFMVVMYMRNPFSARAGEITQPIENKSKSRRGVPSIPPPAAA